MTTKQVTVTLIAIGIAGAAAAGFEHWQKVREFRAVEAEVKAEFAPKIAEMERLKAVNDKRFAEKKRIEAAVVQAVTNRIREKLLAPTMVKFHPIYANADKEQNVFGVVDAQNGYGAMIESSYLAEVYVHDDGSVSVIKAQFMKEIGGDAKETEKIWK